MKSAPRRPIECDELTLMPAVVRLYTVARREDTQWMLAVSVGTQLRKLVECHAGCHPLLFRCHCSSHRVGQNVCTHCSSLPPSLPPLSLPPSIPRSLIDGMYGEVSDSVERERDENHQPARIFLFKAECQWDPMDTMLSCAMQSWENAGVIGQT